MGVYLLKSIGQSLDERDWKESARSGTVAALPANTRTSNTLDADANGALPAIDGVTMAVADRILVMDEGTGANNGLYRVSSLGGAGSKWKLIRTNDANTSTEVTAGMTMFIDEGTVNGDTIHSLTTNDPITLNTTALVFAKTGASVTDHGALTGLADDDHAQYALLVGRTGGQTLIGGDASGNNLDLRATSNASGGEVRLFKNGTVIVAQTTIADQFIIGGVPFAAMGRVHIFDNGMSDSSLLYLEQDNEDVDSMRLRNAAFGGDEWQVRVMDNFDLRFRSGNTGIDVILLGADDQLEVAEGIKFNERAAAPIVPAGSELVLFALNTVPNKLAYQNDVNGQKILATMDDIFVLAGVETSTEGEGNITLSGDQTLNGFLTAGGSRVVVTEQTDKSENGIYNAVSGAWARSPDFNEDLEVFNNIIVYVTNAGSTKLNFHYLLRTDDPITVGVSDQVWEEIAPFVPHALGGSDHTADTLANLNTKISDATLDDSSATRTPSAHDLGGAEHNADTLANLNAKVSDATLDDSSATRTPSAHASSHEENGSDELFVEDLGTASATAGQTVETDGSGGLSLIEGADGYMAWTLNGGVGSGTFQDGSRAMRKAGNILSIIVIAGSRGNTGTSLFDINKHTPAGAITTQQNNTSGTTIYTTQGNRPDLDGLTVSSGDNAIKQATAPDVDAFAADDFFSFDVDSSVAQLSDITIMMYYKYT